MHGIFAAIFKHLIEWTKIAACAGRPIGSLFWKLADASTNLLNRTILPPPPPIGAQAVRTARGEPSILLFDGVCLLCSTFVHFVIDHDQPPAEKAAANGRDFQFAFATLQSVEGRSYLLAAGLPLDVSTVVLIDHEGVHTRSTAALRVLKGCSGGWAWMHTLFIWVPTPLRDLGYKLVARYRYLVFGKDDGETCRMMTKGLRARFKVPAWDAGQP